MVSKEEKKANPHELRRETPMQKAGMMKDAKPPRENTHLVEFERKAASVF
jgi:hypothetical protein